METLRLAVNARHDVFHSVLEGLLYLRPEGTNCGSHFRLAKFDFFFHFL
jgi:hypothetical protein